MPNLTKRDIVIRISNDTGLVQKNVKRVINSTLRHVTESLMSGHAVEFRNFGRFEVRFRAQRIGRNPRLPNHDILIPPGAVVKFKAGKIMKARMEKISEDDLLKRQSAGSKANSLAG